MRPNTLVLRMLAVFRLLRCISAIGDRDDVVALVRDVLLFQRQATYVTAFVCMDGDSMLKLSTTLSKEGYSSELHTTCRGSDLNYYQDHFTMFVLDLNCPDALDCLKKAETVGLFRSPNRWILFDSNLKQKYFPIMNAINISIEDDNPYSNTTEQYALTKQPKKVNIKEYLLKLNEFKMLCDSNILLAVRENITSYTVAKIYKRNRTSRLVVDLAGSWGRTAGLQLAATPVDAVRRMDLQGTLLTATVVVTDNDTLNHLTDFVNKHVDSITKVNYALTNHIMDSLNARKRFVFENTWGYLTPQGWSGMIGWLNREEAEIGATPLFVTADRVHVIEYIALTTPSVTRFLFRQPPLSYVSNIFLLPFSWTVWCASAALVVIAIVALLISSKWENKHPTEATPPCDTCGTGDNILSGQLGEVCLVAVGAVTQQGSSVEPRSIHGRLLILIMFVVLMFLFTAYSANIVALIQSPSTSIKTLTDLLNSKMKLGVEDLVYNRHYFPRMTEPVRKAIWEKKISPKGSAPHFMELKEGIERMRQGLFAFHTEIGPGYQMVQDNFQEHEKCGIQEIAFLQVSDPWYAIQKNCTYKEMIKISIRRIKETGVQRREVDLIYTKKPLCTAIGSSFVSVGLVEVRPALLWMAWGGLLAVGVLALEIVYHKREIIKLWITRRTVEPAIDEYVE